MKTLTLNDREIEIIQRALERQRDSIQGKLDSNAYWWQRRELAINELYNIESVEKKIKLLKKGQK